MHMSYPRTGGTGRSRHAGFTLVELLIATVAGLLIIAAGVSVLTSTLRSNTEALHYTRMNQDLRAVHNALVNDLTRAGAWGVASQVAHVAADTDLLFSGTTGTVTVRSVDSGSVLPNGAFGSPLGSSVLVGRTLVLLIPDASGAGTRFDLSIQTYVDASTVTATIPSGISLSATIVRAGGWTLVNPFNGISVGASNDCIVFAYDVDVDGVLDTSTSGGGASEVIGYRYDSSDRSIEYSANAASCTDTAAQWADITDPQVLRITGLTITQVQTQSAASNQLNGRVREYIVTLDGRLQSDAAADRSLRESVKVRNNEFF